MWRVAEMCHVQRYNSQTAIHSHEQRRIETEARAHRQSRQTSRCERPHRCCRLRIKRLKAAHTRLPSVGFRSWSRFLAVSLQVTWVINLAVGCYYFPPDLQLPPQPLRGLLPILLLGEQRHNGCEQFALRLLPDSVAAAIWIRALLSLSPAR